MNTFFWHDYETWGANPAIDRPSQFAGVRTDEDLNIIDDPLVVYCQPPPDIWPHPQACLVTGILPQKAMKEGIPESQFIARIHQEFSKPKTCVVGYNSLRFDDEVTRYALYRNFFDPYEREWRNGNSRWDIIDMMRLTYALRPAGIEWPLVEGKPSFKLENLTQANGIGHQSAHDAYSDVTATIDLARLVKRVHPELYHYVLTHRSKHKVAAMIDIRNKKPLIHISSRFSAERGCLALVVPLAMHPVNKNAVVVYDLAVDPAPLIKLSADEIRERVFCATADLPEGKERIPLKLVHLNRCPVLATPKLLDDVSAKRLALNKTLCEKHWHTLLNYDLQTKLQALYSNEHFPPRTDPEQQLYSGFISGSDKKVCEDVRRADAQGLAETSFVFTDPRLANMLLRYKARNYPESLTLDEREEWREHVRLRLHEGDENCLSYAEFRAEIELLLASATDSQRVILDALDSYAREKINNLAET